MPSLFPGPGLYSNMRDGMYYTKEELQAQQSGGASPWLQGASGLNYADIAGSSLLSSVGGDSGASGYANNLGGLTDSQLSNGNYSDATTPQYANGQYGQGTLSSGSFGSQYGNTGISSGNSGTPGLSVSGNGGITIAGQGGYAADFGTMSSYNPSQSFSGGGSSGGAAGGGDQNQLGIGVGANTQSDNPFTGTAGAGGFGNVSGVGAGAGNQQASTNVYAPTPQSYAQAGQMAVGYLNNAMSQITQQINQGQIRTQQQLEMALNNISSQTGLGMNEIQSAFNQAQTASNTGFNQGANDISSYLNQAIQNYAPIAGQAAGDMNYLRNAGQQGFDQDFNQYMNSSAFKFPLQQAIGGVEQSAANAGKLFSGATGKAIADRASDFTSQQYMNYNNQRFNQANQIATNSLGALQNQGNLQSTAGQTLGQLRSNQGTNNSGLLSTYGTNVLNARQNTGTNLANAQLGFGTQQNNLTAQMAEALGQQGNAAADYTYNSQLGRGTRAIEIKV